MWVKPLLFTCCSLYNIDRKRMKPPWKPLERQRERERERERERLANYEVIVEWNYCGNSKRGYRVKLDSIQENYVLLAAATQRLILIISHKISVLRKWRYSESHVSFDWAHICWKLQFKTLWYLLTWIYPLSRQISNI